MKGVAAGLSQPQPTQAWFWLAHPSAHQVERLPSRLGQVFQQLFQLVFQLVFQWAAE
jgi:hypothetical protein